MNGDEEEELIKNQGAFVAGQVYNLIKHHPLAVRYSVMSTLCGAFADMMNKSEEEFKKDLDALFQTYKEMREKEGRP